jgi:uncharacterized protein
MPLLTAITLKNKRIAVDSNVLVALIDANDKWHDKAEAIFLELRSHQFEPVYFDCVMNETINVLGRRTKEQGRTDQLPTLLSDLVNRVSADVMTWISQETQRLYQQIIQMVLQHKGELNFHDALIALSCQELDVPFIFSFDTDFDDVDWLIRIADTNDIPDTSSDGT